MSRTTTAGENYAAFTMTTDAGAAAPVPDGPPPAVQLIQLTSGGAVAQAISVAARLGLADVLADGSSSSAELARAVDAHAPTLYRLLRALADYGIVTETERDVFRLTPMGSLLRTDAPGSMRGWATMVGLPFHRAAWTGLYDAVRTGEPAFARVHGVDLFSYLAGDPDDAAVFDAAMESVSSNFLISVVEAYDFTRFPTIVDVGGGTGTLLAAALTASPRSRGVLFDKPQVLRSAPHVLESAGVQDRCRLVAGDFFTSIPAGGELYVLSNIVHDWDDDAAVRILRRCRDAMGDNGRLLIVELVLPDDLAPSPAKLYDLEMLALTPNGRHRTGGEYRELAAAAGLQVTTIVPAYLGQSASYVEAEPAAPE
jgi:O-methyltransferase domain